MYDSTSNIFINLVHLQAGEMLPGLSAGMMDELTGAGRQILASMAAVFNQAIKAGEVRALHPMELVDMFWGFCSGLILWLDSKKYLNQEKDFMEPTFTVMTEVFLQGISPAGYVRAVKRT